jgi:hypothetical protein
MNYELEDLTSSRLPVMEAGQLTIRCITDLGTIDESLKTDVPYNNYTEKLSIKSELYFGALAQVRKREETELIFNADNRRDKTIGSFGMAIRLHLAAADPEEAEVARGLNILFNTYKNIAKLPYEAESLAIDKFVAELNKPVYSEKIAILHMQKYVNNMAEANEAFKNLFSQRLQGVASTEVFDIKSIRAEMLTVYNDFCEYVLAMAKATELPLFVNSLNLINTARKYYADLMARRQGTTEGEEPPVTG